MWVCAVALVCWCLLMCLVVCWCALLCVVVCPCLWLWSVAHNLKLEVSKCLKQQRESKKMKPLLKVKGFRHVHPYVHVYQKVNAHNNVHARREREENKTREDTTHHIQEVDVHSCRSPAVVLNQFNIQSRHGYHHESMVSLVVCPRLF